MLSTPYTAARGLDDDPGGPMPEDDPDDPRGPEDSPYYSKKELYRAPALGPVDARRDMTSDGPERPAVPEPAYIDTSRRSKPQRDVDAAKINQLMAGLGALGTIAAGDERTTLSAIGAGLADAGVARQQQQDEQYRQDLRGYQQWLADARKRNAQLRQSYRQQQYEAERSDYEHQRDQKQWRERKRFIDEQDDADRAEKREQAYQDWKRRREYKSENPTYSERTSRMQENRLAGEGEDEKDGPTQAEREDFRDARYDMKELNAKAQAVQEEIQRLKNTPVDTLNAAASPEKAKRKRQAKIAEKEAELEMINAKRNRVNARLTDQLQRTPGLQGESGRRGGDGQKGGQQQQQRAEKPALEAVNEVLQQRGRETLSEQEYEALGVDDLQRAGLLE